jgi:hypothetical protein
LGGSYQCRRQRLPPINLGVEYKIAEATEENKGKNQIGLTGQRPGTAEKIYGPMKKQKPRPAPAKTKADAGFKAGAKVPVRRRVKAMEKRVAGKDKVAETL